VQAGGQKKAKQKKSRREEWRGKEKEKSHKKEADNQCILTLFKSTTDNRKS